MNNGITKERNNATDILLPSVCLCVCMRVCGCLSMCACVCVNGTEKYDLYDIQTLLPSL